MRKCMDTTVHFNGTVQLIFFLEMRLNIPIVTSCDWFFCNSYTLISRSLYPENGLRKYVRKVTEIKHEFVKLVMIFFLLTRCDYVIPSLSLSLNDVLKCSSHFSHVSLLVCLPHQS